jgi:hypothetical protein
MSYICKRKARACLQEVPTLLPHLSIGVMNSRASSVEATDAIKSSLTCLGLGATEERVSQRKWKYARNANSVRRDSLKYQIIFFLPKTCSIATALVKKAPLRASDGPKNAKLTPIFLFALNLIGFFNV